MRKFQIFYLVGAFLVGLSLPFLNVTLFLYLVSILVILSFISVGLLISTLVLGRKALVWSFYFGFPVLACFSTYLANRYVRHKKAEIVIKDIERYRFQHRVLPNALNELNTVSIIGLTYDVNAESQTYIIEYNMEEFNSEYYSSIDKKWGTRGWND